MVLNLYCCLAGDFSSVFLRDIRCFLCFYLFSDVFGFGIIVIWSHRLNWRVFPLLCFLEEFVMDRYYFLFDCVIQFIREASVGLGFLCWKIFNY